MPILQNHFLRIQNPHNNISPLIHASNNTKIITHIY